MNKWRQWLATGSFACGLWTGLCFALASAVYLSWLQRLVALVGAGPSDWSSMVVGYLFQSAGALAAMRWMKARSGENHGRSAALAIVLFAAVSAPAMLTDSPAAVLIFGWLMNLLCGVLAGYYLYAIAASAAANRRGLAFGGGYAAATVAVGALALVGGGMLTRGHAALLVCLALAALAAWTALKLPLFETRETPAQGDPVRMAEPTGRDLALTCGVVVLISAVKNLGFAFPSADIQAGLIPHLSRLPYAVGLAAAGVVIDRSRKNGMICTLAAMALPFIMLGLTNEPAPSTVLWGLDYLFFGFFSVFRVVLLVDMAVRARKPEWAALGLAMGRLGDVAGTGAALALSGQQVALIAVTTVAFACAVYLLLGRFQKLYEPAALEQKNEREVFESFCLRSDLSNREREVLRMVLAGHSNAGIAEALFITENTVKYHMRNVLQKTGCKNRTELQRQYTMALYPHFEDNIRVMVRDDAG